VLVRTWNVFHGNTDPPGRKRYLREIVELAVADDPALVFLQELPVAALDDLERWTGYTVVGDVASRPRLPRRLAARVTDLHPGLIRSALEGQANAILLQQAVKVQERFAASLNPRRVRERLAEGFELPFVARLAWGKERRVVQAARVLLPDGRSAVVGNLHATSYRPDKRIADAELERAATFVDALAEPGEAVVLAGDFNVTVVSSPTLRALGRAEWGFSEAGPGVDHVLVRGLRVLEPERHWDDERRRRGDVLLSDHDPVDVVVA
jgi:endonuclease/exonuclease/phosphatase family metal-dependent hydrolase